MYVFFAENKEWIFSGIGVFFLSLLIAFLKWQKKDGLSQLQKTGRNSINLQSKGSITINGEIHNESNSEDR